MQGALSDHFGRRPIIYSGRGFWTSYLRDTTKFSKYGLWMANHTSASRPVQLPGGWAAWSYWQYKATGSINGISGAVDLNLSCGYPGSTPSTSPGCPSACTEPSGSTTRGGGWPALDHATSPRSTSASR